ncbi:RNA polymerase sigma factor [Pimelobacter simplex]|nr:RNA polymerase sigma factor [Pimelobacter simplex]
MDGRRGADDLDVLYAGCYRRLVVQMYAICGVMADAEDAVQEAFITAIRKRRTLQAVQNPEAWIRTVALHRLHHGWRHQAAERLPKPAVDVGPEHVALVTALGLLDAGQREVVVLHHLADLSVAEIAADLGLPVGTVKSRLGRGRARLGELLAEREEPSHG